MKRARSTNFEHFEVLTQKFEECMQYLSAAFAATTGMLGKTQKKLQQLPRNRKESKTRDERTEQTFLRQISIDY